MKKVFCIVLLLLLMTSLLAGCQGGVDREKAHADVAAFFEKIADGDYAAAEAYLHPANALDLEKYFDTLENEIEGLDFQAGLAVKNGSNFSWSYYDSKVSGSQYTSDYVLTVGEISLDVSVQIVQNDDGYGIYSLTIREG